MGLFGRVQINGALQRLGKRIAANPHIWQMAGDGRPRFDNWVEEHASDKDLMRAGMELVAFLGEIPPRYKEREWGQQLVTIVQASLQVVENEARKRGLLEGDASGEPDRSVDADQARRPIIEIFKDALKQERRKRAGQTLNETGERTMRLDALINSTFEFYKSVPVMDRALTDSNNRNNMTMSMTIEYMPLLMLAPDELPRVFAEYMLWKFGNEQATQSINIEYIRDAFQRGIALLPPEMHKSTLSLKDPLRVGEAAVATAASNAAGEKADSGTFRGS